MAKVQNALLLSRIEPEARLHPEIELHGFHGITRSLLGVPPEAGGGHQALDLVRWAELKARLEMPEIPEPQRIPTAE